VGLDVTPVVGTAKNVLELFTGDLIPDKKKAKSITPGTPTTKEDQSTPDQTKALNPINLSG
jgi:hypothetical protein